MLQSHGVKFRGVIEFSEGEESSVIADESDTDEMPVADAGQSGREAIPKGSWPRSILKPQNNGSVANAATALSRNRPSASQRPKVSCKVVSTMVHEYYDDYPNRAGCGSLYSGARLRTLYPRKPRWRADDEAVALDNDPLSESTCGAITISNSDNIF